LLLFLFSVFFTIVFAQQILWKCSLPL